MRSIRACLLVLMGVLAAALGCQHTNPRVMSDGQGESVPLISPRDLITRIQAGDNVVFVDVREPQEYSEGHIPGAINIPQRDLEARRGELVGADLVIPYCNMDFRGFYSVKDLRALGIEKVALMQERGLHGWRDQGLPVAIPGKLSDEDALRIVMNTDPAQLMLGKDVTRVRPNGRVRHIRVSASNWYFEPNDLMVNAGDTIHFYLESKEGDHFFVQPDFEVGVDLQEGKTTEVVFVADRAGDFRYGSCEWTGTDLQVMKGRLRVREVAQ